MAKGKNGKYRKEMTDTNSEIMSPKEMNCLHHARTGKDEAKHEWTGSEGSDKENLESGEETTGEE